MVRRLKSISLKGWRSIDYEGIKLKGLNRFNLIIGENNSGKTNLFRYFFLLSLDYYPTETYAEWKEKVQDKFNIVNSVENTWKMNSKSIISELVIEEQFGIKDTKNYKRLSAKHYSNGNSYFYNKHKLKSPPNKTIYDFPNSKDSFQDWMNLVNRVEYFNPLRDLNRENSGSEGFNGFQFIDHFRSCKEEFILHHYCYLISNWLTYILQEEIRVLKPNIIEYKNPFGEQMMSIDYRLLRLDISKRREYKLESFGTGLSQIVMILTHLYFRCYYDKYKNMFILLEEPETNLHPNLLNRFVDILEENFKSYQFFISSHSPVLMDRLNEQWSIYKFSRTIAGGTSVTRCLNKSDKFELLDELGVRPSQILLSNLIIWVEGPSDVTYLRKWIKDRSNDELKENIDFSFAMYGGKNLFSFGIYDEEDYDNTGDLSHEFIDILKSSRYSYVLCDSDKKSHSSASKKKVIELKNDVEDKNLDNFVIIRETDGREIENYIPHKLLKKVLNNEGSFKRKSIGKKKNYRKLKYNDSRFKRLFADFDSFDEFFSGYYYYEDTSDNLNRRKLRKLRENVKEGYSQKKPKIAKEVINVWEDKDYTPQLIKLIDEIIDMIYKANGKVNG